MNPAEEGTRKMNTAQRIRIRVISGFIYTFPVDDQLGLEFCSDPCEYPCQ